MKKRDVIAHFGTLTNVAHQLGVTKAAISQWPDEVPVGRDYQIEIITKGALKAELRKPKERRVSRSRKKPKKERRSDLVSA